MKKEIDNKIYKLLDEPKHRLIPITRGCKNDQCFCTGECNEVIGFRDSISGEVMEIED